MGTSRKDAGLVEQDYETQVQDETVESGENAEHLEENSRSTEARCFFLRRRFSTIHT
jgi:hypothetical protein